MSERVTMPALGESVTEGTVTRWLKAVGERVEVDEPLLEVSTDKVDTEIPSPVAGVLEEILVQEDDTVPVGADLAVIGDGSGGGDQEQAPAAEEEPAEAPADNSGQAVTATRSTTPRTRTRSRRPGTRAARNRPSPRPRRLPRSRQRPTPAPATARSAGARR